MNTITEKGVNKRQTKYNLVQGIDETLLCQPKRRAAHIKWIHVHFSAYGEQYVITIEIKTK